MKYNSKFDRRLFLAQLSSGLGLYTASNLFNYKAFAQTNTVKKNIIFIYFLHGANIPKNDVRGTFHFNSGSTISAANNMKNDAFFIRNVNHIFKNGSRDHDGGAHANNQSAGLTGFTSKNIRTAELHGLNGSKYNGRSLDLVLGDHLKSKYNSITNHLNLGYHNKHGDNTTDNHPYMWETSTFLQSGKPTKPIIEVGNAFNKVKGELNCDQKIESNDKQGQIAQINKEINQLQLIESNLNSYKSQYLLPNEEFDKLKAQVAQQIENKNKFINDLNSDRSLASAPAECRQFSVASNFNDKNWRGYDNFNKKSLAYFDLMTYALKYNYTKSITYYTNIWDNKQHGEGAHKKFNNSEIRKYQDELFKTLDQLIVKLKGAGIYDETMIAITGEFGMQNIGNGNKPAHRNDKIPWLIVNSGKTGEFYDRTSVHPGDIHCAIANRMGLSLNEFGSNTHETKRTGNNNKKILG